ncbi:hypothetical protein N7492_008899 [Penicillium capsulatum]|uniref:Uncharacterized protein n=1 Tax=Penicillium capsulatum TaxID=69766 RepID=A0A9W9HUD6_9EURO|nr:hypothetical protein N7492_008899 [Penicillium capsulatum]
MIPWHGVSARAGVTKGDLIVGNVVRVEGTWDGIPLRTTFGVQKNPGLVPCLFERSTPTQYGTPSSSVLFPSSHGPIR